MPRAAVITRWTTPGRTTGKRRPAAQDASATRSYRFTCRPVTPDRLLQALHEYADGKRTTTTPAESDTERMRRRAVPDRRIIEESEMSPDGALPRRRDVIDESVLDQDLRKPSLEARSSR